jgi:hypothetical protein
MADTKTQRHSHVGSWQDVSRGGVRFPKHSRRLVWMRHAAIQGMPLTTIDLDLPLEYLKNSQDVSASGNMLIARDVL